MAQSSMIEDGGVVVSALGNVGAGIVARKVEFADRFLPFLASSLDLR